MPKKFSVVRRLLPQYTTTVQNYQRQERLDQNLAVKFVVGLKQKIQLICFDVNHKTPQMTNTNDSGYFWPLKLSSQGKF